MASTRITWQDVLQAPDDGRRYEAVAGALLVTPAPSVRHQRVSANLFEALRRILHHSGRGLVLAAPVGVEFPDDEEGVQPDIVFVTKERESIVGEDWIWGAPDLIVEILSPATAARDRGIKRELYGRQGVAEYWIADPDARTIEVWRFAAGARQPEIRADRLPIGVGDETVGAIDLAAIFA